MRPSRLFAILALAVAAPPVGLAQGPFKAEVLKEAPPAALAAAVKSELAPEGYRVVNGEGKPYVDIWLRKATPSAAKPSGPNGTVQFPTLAEGVLLGAVRYATTGQDYRDQPIKPGVYTIRYGLQPQNGAHLGASDYRDFALLLPGAKDLTPVTIAKKPLDERSAEAVGTSHPGVLVLLASAEPAKADAPAVIEDAQKNTWGVVVPLPLAVKGESTATTLDVQLIVSGAAMP